MDEQAVKLNAPRMDCIQDEFDKVQGEITERVIDTEKINDEVVRKYNFFVFLNDKKCGVIE